MTRAEIDAGVREILGRVLRRPVPPGEEVSRATEAGWDSLRHVEVLFAVEDFFGVRLDEAELAHLTSSRKIGDSVERLRGS